AHTSNFTGGKRDLRPAAFAGSQGGTRTGAAAELATVSGLHLQVMDRHAQRDAAKRHTVASPRLAFSAADDPVPGLQPLRRQDVYLLPVLVFDQCDPRRPVGVVFNRDDGGPHVVLASFEVDDAIHALVTAPTEARADDAVMIAPALFGVRKQ